MKKNKYFFNPHNLEFEKVTVSLGSRLLRIFGFMSATMVAAALVLFLAYTYIDSPKEKQLKREIAQYKLQMKLMDQKVDNLAVLLDELSTRDDNIYRAIFEADPLPDEVRNAGFGGVNRYKELEGYDNTELLKALTQKMDKLSNQMYVQSKSYDELSKLASRKNDMLASIPAIQPVSNRDLNRMASGFGYRIHPVYKTRKLHTGMDFSAPTGTEIYATGNGKVVSAEYDRGYGYHVVIDHGFGYQTLYGHMSKMKVKKGQTVNRGEVIGLIGNTGTSTAPHLHYEVIKNNKKINPINFYFNDLSAEEYDRVREIANQANQSFD
ncbi:MAG: M23 family metallopeptidase [Bacteroidetes bacterium]|nr:MAG: M23 family metallopeptidase [Bacteroidota bacterium]